MRRICVVFLAIACCLSLFGCKKEAEPAPTTAPTQVPTAAPTQAPTEEPTTVATEVPTEVPTEAPTEKPTKEPSKKPTKVPTTAPTTASTEAPTGASTAVPTAAPTTASTEAPTGASTAVPTAAPTTAPTEAPTEAPTAVPTEAPHQHIFGEWVLQAVSTCAIEGREERRCACGHYESRDLPLEPHRLNDQNVCKTCLKVSFDDHASLVELGVVCDTWYGSGNMANYAWDIKYWNGKIYRGAGDYDKNSGDTTILAYNIATQVWERTGSAADEAVHSFIEIGGTLAAPGIDPQGGWSLGNFYVLQDDGKWQQVRNLPNGIHCFDMIECNGKIFAGLGTETTGKTVAVSEDGGKTFTFAPLYKDGYSYIPTGAKSSRTYEFVKYNGDVYALVWFQAGFGGMYEVFRYEDGKMHYVAEGYKLTGGMGISRKYFGGEFEFGGACYITTDTLNVITDFSDAASWKTVSMPNAGRVSDAILRDGVIYVLSSKQDSKTKLYHTVIYQSTTGAPDSFAEVLSYDYGGFPLSFDYDGEHFYIGTGNNTADKSKTGMVLRATPEK